MRGVRWLAAAVVCGLALFAVYRFSWLPYRCEIAQKRTEAAVLMIIDLPTSQRGIQVARKGIEDMERCVAICPTNVGLYMAVAANDQALGRLEDAANAYTAALQFDRRPELYLNLGLVQLQLKRRQEAVRNLTTACLFNINFINDISDPEIRSEVLNTVHLEQNRLIAAARRGRT